MSKCLENFEWRGVLDGSEVHGLSRSEIKDVLKSCMFRRMERNLRREVKEKPKLTVLKSIREKGYICHDVHKS